MEHDFLKDPTVPIRIEDRGVSELLEAMEDTGFQGRRLGEAARVWKEMLKEDDITIFLGLAGAMVPAGMRRVVSYLIRNRMVDCLVSTGANIFHDIHEALGRHHFKGHPGADDSQLHRCGIDRIYDVFALEEEFREIDALIASWAEEMDPEREYSSREVCRFLGEKVEAAGGDEDSIVVSARKSGVPVFVPALGDSSIGIGLVLARRKGRRVVVSHIKDVDEITGMVEKSTKTGVIYVGGGVPKNFVQQTEVITSILGTDKGGHEYAIQFTTDAPHWGGLTGCSFEEGVSWGKISKKGRKVQVFVDATIALPVVVQALHDWASGGFKRKNPPVFRFEGVT
ncbi:MAG: deoxyhypusine synthase [Euryarchaeota archaeon]|nr:deoxyhypusine synthase [Euryarchaeota archaeon]